MKSQLLKIHPQAKDHITPIKSVQRYRHKIAISLETGLVIINTKDIHYCQAQSSYCKIVLKSGKSYLVSKTMKRVKTVLNPTDFIKVHQSYIVAIDAIYKMDDGIILDDETNIPVSRSKRKEVLERLSLHFQMV